MIEWKKYPDEKPKHRQLISFVLKGFGKEEIIFGGWYDEVLFPTHPFVVEGGNSYADAKVWLPLPDRPAVFERIDRHYGGKLND